MTETAATHSRRDRGRFWIGIVGVIFAMQMSVGAVLLYYAHSDPSFAVEEDYYDKALRWDDDAAARRASDQLGWSIDLHIGGAVGALREKSLLIHLVDRDGAPVAGASVDVRAHHNARAGDFSQMNLVEGEPGEYAVALQIRLPGVWVFEVRANLGEDVFLHEIRRDVATDPGSAS